MQSNDEDFIRTPDEAYNDRLIGLDNTPYINHSNQDDDLQKAIQASIELEEQNMLKIHEKNRKIKLFSQLDKIFHILRFDTSEYNVFFLECVKKSIDNYIENKTTSIQLFKRHYVLFNDIIEESYTTHVERNRKPKICIELYECLKNHLHSI